MPGRPGKPEEPKFIPGFWDALIGEMKLLLCGKDKKYADLRRKLNGLGTKSNTVITSTIAVAVAGHLGEPVGLLTPFVAKVLLVVARLGREAFCASHPFDTDLV